MSNEPEFRSLESGGPMPSSFDDSEFFEESRSAKIMRKLRQEPLIPLGVLATCYALYAASKSIRAGTPLQTNKMFRARIYAQGFTLVAIVAGSIYYKDERVKRKAIEGKVEEKKTLEKREKWLRELEARDREDREWRARVEREGKLKGEGMRDVAIPQQTFTNKSVLEGSRDVRVGSILWRAMEGWKG
jgi:hypothetical protein